MEGCETASIERRLGDFTQNIGEGFVLEGIIEDLKNLRNNKVHLITKGERKQRYQEIIDICVRNKVKSDALIYLTEIRDGKTSSNAAMDYTIHELSWLNLIYLSRTQRAVEASLFRR